MLAGIRDILIITTPQDANSFKNLLGDGDSLGISLKYKVQPNPEGLAQAFLIGEDFIENNPVALILVDNIFYGRGLGRQLSAFPYFDGATIFGVEVDEPRKYGVVEVSSSGEVLSIEEKPINPKSNIAVPGLYFFDKSVTTRAKSVEKSARGELEITTLIDSYLVEKKLKINFLHEDTEWMDCGTIESLNEAANYIRRVEQDTDYKIGCIEEVAYRQGWISYDQMILLIQSLGKNEYANYLSRLLNGGTENER